MVPQSRSRLEACSLVHLFDQSMTSSAAERVIRWIGWVSSLNTFAFHLFHIFHRMAMMTVKRALLCRSENSGANRTQSSMFLVGHPELSNSRFIKAWLFTKGPGQWKAKSFCLQYKKDRWSTGQSLAVNNTILSFCFRWSISFLRLYNLVMRH